MFIKITSLTPLMAFLSLVAAADNRIWVEKPEDFTMDLFETNFKSLCSTYAVDHGIQEVTWNNTYFQRGDYRGENDDTQARIICSYRNAEEKFVLYTVPLAEELGATVLH